jgi:S1-C subfamily serine protease
MTVKQFVSVSLLMASTFAAGAWVYGNYQHQSALAVNFPLASSVFKPTKAAEKDAAPPTVDFANAAESATPAVVHIKILKRTSGESYTPFARNNPEDNGNGLDGMSLNKYDTDNETRQVGSGSGVVISADGYIVTNNHVVEKADQLIVTLNNKKDYKAEIIGTDPSTDLAVIKITGNSFPYLSFANSDDVHVGQWVLAIGYPLNLETTVTAGIVSAKARNIGINSRNSEAPIESFIQTDAAVNPGNSGGALVNTSGKLIGINSAIASPTGSYAGYSYAIPANMVSRVVSDIIKYGSSKRAYLGLTYGSDQMSEADRQKNNIPEGDGVFVMDVAEGSAARNAGIQKGDFITKINGIKINTGTEMVEKISALRPNDSINITYSRNETENTVNAVLQGAQGNYE